jgi:hypothetical protein
MRIVQLEVENLERIKHIKVRPTKGLVVIGGENEQGKTSLLNAIAYALGGKAKMSAVPVRRGAAFASIVCDLGELVIKQKITGDGKVSLSVVSADGKQRYNSPQTLLETLYSKHTIDPLAFMNMEPRRQAEALRLLVGLDFSTLDRQRKALHDERALAGHDVTGRKTQIDSMPHHPDAPASEVDVAELREELDYIQQHNELQEKLQNNLLAKRGEIDNLKSVIASRQRDHDALRQSIIAGVARAKELRVALEGMPAAELIDTTELEQQIAELNRQLEEARAHNRDERKKQDVLVARQNELANLRAAVDTDDRRVQEIHGRIERDEVRVTQLTAELAAMPKPEMKDANPIFAKIGQADGINRKVRDNNARLALLQQFSAAKARYEALTAQIDAIDASKRQMLQEATFPVPGLSFDESGVMFDGLPLEQASSAKRLEISTAIGLAMNPKLKVLLLRDGSLVGGRIMKRIEEMAEAADAQIWLETISTGEECEVIMEDGCAVQPVEA